MLPTFEYLCLNKFCNSGQSTFIGSREWYHNLVSPNNVRLNLWTFTPSTKQCVFTQSFEWSRCPSASSSGFPENYGLELDQFKYTSCCSCCPAGFWISCCCCWFCCCCCCWFCYCCHCWLCCCCHWLGAGTPSPLSAILAYFALIYFNSNLWHSYLSDLYPVTLFIINLNSSPTLFTHFCNFLISWKLLFYFLNNWYPWYQLMILSQISSWFWDPILTF